MAQPGSPSKSTQTRSTARAPPKGTRLHGTARVPGTGKHWWGWEPRAWHGDGSTTGATCQPPAAPNLPSADTSFLSAPTSSPANRSLRSLTAAQSSAAMPGLLGRWASSWQNAGTAGEGYGPEHPYRGTPQWKLGMPDDGGLEDAPAGDATLLGDAILVRQLPGSAVSRSRSSPQPGGAGTPPVP